MKEEKLNLFFVSDFYHFEADRKGNILIKANFQGGVQNTI